VYQLIYRSQATHPICPTELDALLFRSRPKNARTGITGLLVYHDRTFLHWIEGETRAVQALYRKIRLDPRHMDTTVLIETAAARRKFAAWNMGLFNADLHPLWDLPGFAEEFDDLYTLEDIVANPQTASRFIHQFGSVREWRILVEVGRTPAAVASA